MEWLQSVIVISYAIGVFALLPLVIYTNLSEKLARKRKPKQGVYLGLDEEERNQRAFSVARRIEEQLTPIWVDNEARIAVETGKQARFMKRGLTYINKTLRPTNEDAIAQMDDLAAFYHRVSQRKFVGSYWIIFCGLGLAALFVWFGSSFVFFHLAGLIFYFMASRVPVYELDRVGPGSGLGGLFGSLLSPGSKHYVREGGGPWRRDTESEAMESIIGLVISIIFAILLGFLAPLVGIFNFMLYYMTSLPMPLLSGSGWRNWYTKNVAAKLSAAS